MLSRLPRRTVLHVAEPLHAGVPRVAADLAAEQVRRGWDVAVACPPASRLTEWAAAAGARVHPWEAVRSPGPSVPGEVRRLAAVVRAADPDVVHLHSAKAGLAGRLLLRGRRATVFQPNAWSFEVPGRAARPAQAWERVAARWTDLLLCVSEDERRTGAGAGVRGRMVVVPNGVDAERWRRLGAEDRAAARDRLGLPPAAPLAICVGRLGPQKNQGALLDAWPLVRAQVPDAEVALVGDGEDRPALEARRVAGVRFPGQAEDVQAWLAAADLVVQPSRYEGLSLALLESLASARSVVATEATGMRETLLPGGGAVVPHDDPEALAAAVVARLTDPALAASEGAAGRARVEERYDLRLVGERVTGLYEDVLARRAGSSIRPGEAHDPVHAHGAG